jgi:hypothetical protein
VEREERINPDEKLVVEGHVTISWPGGPEPKVIRIWNPRVDKVANLADYIEAAFGSEHNTGFYGPMRMTFERGERIPELEQENPIEPPPV